MVQREEKLRVVPHKSLDGKQKWYHGWPRWWVVGRGGGWLAAVVVAGWPRRWLIGHGGGWLALRASEHPYDALLGHIPPMMVW